MDSQEGKQRQRKQYAHNKTWNCDIGRFTSAAAGALYGLNQALIFIVARLRQGEFRLK